MRSFAAILLFLLLTVTTGSATPPRWGDVTIIPVASNQKGMVLFKTVARFSPFEISGRTNDFILGWLVVSAGGVWDEVTERKGGGESALGGTEEPLQRADDLIVEAFLARTAWDNSSEPLRALIARYGFSRKDEVVEDSGAGEYSWVPDQLYQGKRLLEGTYPQRTLFNNVSRNNGGFGPIPCSFHCRGVILFKNGTMEENHSRLGAHFPLTEGFFPVGGKPHPLDAILKGEEWEGGDTIDGICVIPGELR